MYKGIMKKLLLFCALFLFIANASLGCWGPCRTISACGGVGGGMGTCAWTNGDCSGNCASSCEAGPNDEYCVGTSEESCYPRMVRCTPIMDYICTIEGGHCACAFEYDTGDWCFQQLCSTQ